MTIPNITFESLMWYYAILGITAVALILHYRRKHS